MKKFNDALDRMVIRATEYKSEYEISFQSNNFENEFKDIINNHVSISYPGLENGVF